MTRSRVGDDSAWVGDWEASHPLAEQGMIEEVPPTPECA